MNNRMRIDNVLYETVDLRTNPPKFKSIRNGENELFYDKSVGAIKSVRSNKDGYDSRSIHFSRVVSDDLTANFVNVWIELPDEIDSENPFRGIEVTVDGKDYIINDLEYDVTDHDLRLIFDNILRDIYHRMELSSEKLFVDTVKVSARRSISKYGLTKWDW